VKNTKYHCLVMEEMMGPVHERIHAIDCQVELGCWRDPLLAPELRCVESRLLWSCTSFLVA
jgi:hypothetical protein